LDADISELSTEETSWSFKRNTTHSPVTGYYSVDLTLFDSYFIKNTDEKVMYLTFDEGYEEGYTPTILDTLKENNVKATFFITGQFLKTQPDLVKRMLAEGHIVANHSVNHPSFPTLTEEEIYDELVGLANDFKEVTGQEMAPFFRPPSAKYSEKTLYLTRKLGYRTIFYSIAYGDWDTKNQPGKEAAYEHVMTNYHNGAIILLHAVSKSNTEALDDILKDLKALGYRFGSLYELE
jgi:peptidoglycan-N-acetylmuramic acid deacetylase